MPTFSPLCADLNYKTKMNGQSPKNIAALTGKAEFFLKADAA
ncbi:hypothetical protein TRICHSKD4_2964 [Roseibium sp. TrichSKD4]|nr:hypothetical protein TRICHSKD4_2964 [Roseibium sp. TrichSKD4]